MGKTFKDPTMLTILLFLLASPLSFAHLATGEDKEVNGYLIDMGHDPEFITAGEPFTLMLSISNATTEEQLNPRKVWVRIVDEDDSDGTVVFAGTFTPEARSVSVVMSLPVDGDYTIDARFFGEGPKAWAVAEFPLHVQMKKASGSILVWALVVLGTAILCIIGFVWYKAKTTPPQKKK